MTFFQLAGILMTVIVLLGYLNNRFTRLPDSLGITAAGVIVSVIFMIAGRLSPGSTEWAVDVIEKVNFSEVVFHGLLGILLFAGSLHTRIEKLMPYIMPITLLSTASVLISTVVIGFLLYAVLQLIGVQIGLLYCMMFGALISPTDPIAVMAALKGKSLPEPLHARLTGEGLFNDGTGVVAFLTLAGLAAGAGSPSIVDVSLKLLAEILGAITLGVAAGYGALLMIRSLTSTPLKIMVTLTLSVGGYGLAEFVHVSAPISVVVSGLTIGTLWHRIDIGEEMREELLSYWELKDELMNLVLFGLIGIKLVALDLALEHLFIALMAIPIVLAGRAVSIWLPAMSMRPIRKPPEHLIPIMTWGGIRGAISIALALSLPEFVGREHLIAATYAVVIFSLLVQALTIGKLMKGLQSKVSQSKPK